MNDFACTHSHTHTQKQTNKQTNIQNDGWERVGVLNRERAYKVDVPEGATKTCTAWVMLFQTRVIEEAPFIKVAP